MRRDPPGPVTLRRIVIAVTGATGAVYGLRLLEMMRDTPGFETHLVVSQAAVLNIREELPLTLKQFEAAADVVHNVRNVGASIASGSFLCEGMVVAPCSMRTLAAIANGLSDNLITRAADVMLKERRRLTLMVREAPLNLAHLRNMVACSEMGAVIFPLVPGFYTRPSTVQDIVDHSCIRVLDQFGIHREQDRRWTGLSSAQVTRLESTEPSERVSQ